MDNISFKTHLPMEFLYSLFAVGTEKHFYSMISDFNLEPNDEITKAITSLKEGLSSYMEQELYYFFDLSGIGYIFYQYILLHSDITSISKLIEVFNEYESNDLIFRITKSTCNNIFPVEGTTEYAELECNRDKMLDYVEKADFQDIHRKERVLESLKYPEETKQRFSFLLNQFYNRCFVKIEKNLRNLVMEQKEKYQSIFQSNPLNFIEQYLNVIPQDGLNQIICLSFFKYLSWHHYSLYLNDNSEWFILGIYSHLLYDETLCYERFSNFFKTLSDPNRIAILKLLSEKPWYGQELAEKLNITPATISYHMTFLQRSGIITFQKSDNRSYYSINRDKLTKSLEDFIHFF